MYRKANTSQQTFDQDQDLPEKASALNKRQSVLFSQPLKTAAVKTGDHPDGLQSSLGSAKEHTMQGATFKSGVSGGFNISSLQGGEIIFGNQGGSDDSSYESSSDEEDRLDRKVDEVNRELGISYNKKSLNIIKRMVSRKKRRYV